MSYVCGDATKLSECIPDVVDVIYDKGLMDAIFCNEGWNKPIALLIQEASKVLVEGGMYILVSYRLPKSTKEFLLDVGDANNLEWSFDMEGSNDRVGISVARKRSSIPVGGGGKEGPLLANTRSLKFSSKSKASASSP